MAQRIGIDDPDHCTSLAHGIEVQVIMSSSTNNSGNAVSSVHLAHIGEEELRNAFENAAIGIAITDLKGNYVSANRAYCQMVGYREGELRLRGALDLTHPDDLAANERLLDELISGRRDQFVFDKRYISRAGQALHVRLSVSCLRDGQGNPTGLMGVAENIGKQKQAEAELELSRDLLAVASQLGRLGGWTFDVETMEIHWSEEIRALVDLEPGHYPTLEEGLSWYAPHDQPRMQSAFLACLHEGIPYDLELEFTTVRGRHMWVRSIGEAVHDEMGKIVQLHGAFQDISESKMAERELHSKESLLRIAGKVAQVGGWALEREGHNVYWSDEVCEMLDYPPGVNPSLEEALHHYPPGYREEITSALLGCLEEGTPFDLELELVTVAGRRIWVRCRGEAMYDQQGNIVRVHGAFQDISEQKEIARTLGRSLELFQQAADAMPFIIWTAEPDGTLDFANILARRYAGVSQQDLSNGKWMQAIHPDDVAGVIEGWREGVQAGERRSAEFRLRRVFDNSYRWHLVRGIPFHNEEGKVVKWYGSGIDIHDTKLLEKEARQLAERLSNTLESITDGFYAVDGDWRFTYINHEGQRMMGQPQDKLLGRSVWEAFPEASGTIIEHSFHKAVSEQRAVEFEVYYEPWEKWLYVRAFPTAEGLAVYFTNITEQRSANERLRASEERFNVVARGTNDAIWDWDLKSDVVWWSDGMETLFGYALEDLEPDSRSWTNRIHPEDREWVVESFFETVEKGLDRWESAYRFLCHDGSVAHVVDRGFVIRDKTGKAIRLVGGMTDRTVHLEYEQKLREQAALLDKASDAIMVKGLDDTITFWNQSAARIYGWQAEEVVGHVITDVLYYEAARYREATEKTLQHGEWTGEMQQRRRDGRPVLVLGRWSLVHDDEGNPRAIMSVNTDITERKRLEEQFLRAQRMESIGTLTGGIAHDLNNVLSPILLSIPLLRQTIRGEREQRRLEILEKSAQRGADMVRQLLTFARGASGTQITLQLDALIREVQQLLRDTLGKNIKINMVIPEKPWPIEGDPTQLQQVLVNLSVNARDAMPTGGQLLLAVENVQVDEALAATDPQGRVGPYVRLTVADTGTGIPHAIRDRIFEPFFTTKELGRGTGLGLSTVQGIVKGHGGFVQMDSELNKGTVFSIYLPAQETETAAVRQAQRVAPLRGDGELILLVDDESAVRSIMKQTLETYGYHVLTARNGAEGVKMYASHRDGIAAVITDIMMPEMDGVAMLQALRQFDEEVKVIAASGLGTENVVNKLSKLGVEKFLHKPFGAEVLLEALAETLCKRPRA